MERDRFPNPSSRFSVLVLLELPVLVLLVLMSVGADSGASKAFTGGSRVGFEEWSCVGDDVLSPGTLIEDCVPDGSIVIPAPVGEKVGENVGIVVDGAGIFVRVGLAEGLEVGRSDVPTSKV